MLGINPHTGEKISEEEAQKFIYAAWAGTISDIGETVGGAYYGYKGGKELTETEVPRTKTEGASEAKKASGVNTIITPAMVEKIIWGQRKNPNKNEIIGGHSSGINNSHLNYATETIKINPDGWTDTKILDSITDIGNSSPISVRGRDGATFHRGIVDGVEIDVIKLGDNIVSGYPTGQVNAPLPGGFTK